MDLLQENPIKDNREKKLKTSLIIVVVLIFLLILLAGGIYYYEIKTLKKQLKVVVDGITPSSLSKKYDETFIFNQDGTVDVAIKNICQSIGYQYYKGEYGEYNELPSSGYATNEYETVSFTANSNEIIKYPADKNKNPQTFKLDKSIVNRGDLLFISQEGLERAFNLEINYSADTNTITIMTLDYITNRYINYYKKAGKQIGVNDSRDKNINFSNKKALLSNLVVIKDENTGLFGVYRYGEEKPPITEKYKSIEFIEGAEDFIVLTENDKYGIVGKDGITKIKPEYSAISEISKDLGLYLVTGDSGKQGVVNQNGKMIVYQDYDSIGLQDTFGDANVTNKYLLYNSVIPVQLNKKWGLIDKEGNQVLPLEYDGFGSKLSNNRSNSTGCVLVPDMDGIVVEQDSVVDRSVIHKYGIINSRGELIVQVLADEAFITKIENKKTYYVSFQGQNIDIISFWNEQKNSVGTSSNQNSVNTNEINDENTNEGSSNQVNENE